MPRGVARVKTVALILDSAGRGVIGFLATEVFARNRPTPNHRERPAMKRVRNILWAVVGLHLIGCEAIALGLWAPPHPEGVVALTFFFVLTATVPTFIAFVDD